MGTRRRLLALPAALAALCALAGCGLGPGTAPKGAQLAVTRDFGAKLILATSAPRVVGQETIMRLLQRNSQVTTKYGGGFVESIDGRSGGSEGGEPIDWFYYVNGVQAPKGAAETGLHAGDRVWWDLHDWSQTQEVPAVVGSFPEPFLGGIGGKRLPVRVECSQSSASSCATVASRLRMLGVPAALSAFSGGEGAQTLRLFVGPLAAIDASPEVQTIEQGPSRSGVYARFSSNGRTIVLLNARGRPVRTLGAGAGLIAAVRSGENAPLWLVTGTDSAGVTLAASRLSEASLRDRFALALAPGGEQLGLPDGG
jgi:hypothetical protein